MIDRDGYRPNVGIVLCNAGTRFSGASGCGSTPGSSPRAASSPARRPSTRCTGSCARKSACSPEHVRILGRTRRLVALRRARPMDQARLARQLSRPEADLVSAETGRPGLRRVSARMRKTRVRCLALERHTGSRWKRDRFQARRLPEGAERARKILRRRTDLEATICETASHVGELSRS